MSTMRPSKLLRRGEQSGQMLVSVIVLLTLMFFIGSAMALAVSSSLHVIAQTNSMDSVAYAAESAAAQGLASNRRGKAPVVEFRGTGGTPRTWSYAIEAVAADGTLLGRSAVGIETGSDTLDDKNYQEISLPLITGADHFDVYRTDVGANPSGANPSTTGYIGSTTLGQTVFNDTGLPVGVVQATCANIALALPAKKVNGFLPTARSCRVPVGADPTMWAAAAQSVPGNSCKAQPLMVPDPNQPGQFVGFSPGDEPGTAWGVIGWHDVSSSNPADLAVSVDPSCNPSTATLCPRPIKQGNMFYFYCHLDGAANQPPVEYKNLYIVNQAGKDHDAYVSSFVVRAADSGSDCVYTTVGQAGLVNPVTDEADWALPGCVWTGARRSLWNRVLP
jgi:hypothetical protein